VIRRSLTVATLALLTVAGAAGASAVPAATPITETSPVALELTEYGPSVLAAGELLKVSATVTNPTAGALTDLRVFLRVTKAPVKSSAALQRFLDDPSDFGLQLANSVTVDGSGLTVSGTANVLPPGSTASVSLSAGAAALGMPENTTGVYGVVISVEGPEGTVAEQTAAITWYDAQITPLRVAFLATASGSAERVAQVTSAASVSGAALLIDPTMVADAAEATAITSAREVFGLPSRNPDLTSIAHSDDRSLLSFALADSKTHVQPDLQNLPWLASLPVADTATVGLAARRGALAGLLDVTSDEATAGFEGDDPVVDVAAGSDALPVLVPNRDLSQLLASYRPGTPDAAARLVAESALLARAGDGVTPVVVSPGTAWQLSDMGASRAVADLLGAPWVVPVSVQSVISGTVRGAADAADSEGTEDDLAPDLIKALARQLKDVRELSQTVEDPNDVLVPGGRTLLAPLAAGLRSDPDARSTAYQSARDDANALIQSVYVAEGSDVNLIAASGEVPVTLHNDLDVDATVTVVMRSSSPSLVIQDRPVVTIPAGGDITARVAVTGVKSANVTATVALVNDNGDVVAAPQALRVRVRADWGNALTAVFAIGLALLLVAGLVRTIRRGRGSSRMAPMAPPSAGDREDSGDTEPGGEDD
jgi:hypothetical protein